MSTLNVDRIIDSSGGVFAPVSSVFRSRIINGQMVIDQRNAGASVTQTTSGLYTLDRWKTYGTVASKFSVQQNAGAVTPPAGFTNYLGCTSLSTYSVGASDEFILYQLVEGFNAADLDFGKSTAKTITLSFWVRSSLTGTFGGALRNGAANRSYPYTYTISAANTWEQKSVTIAGDTSGTWIGATNGVGIELLFGLGQGASTSGTAGAWASSSATNATGATSVVGTNGATFYITGVQLEVGTQATSFEYRQYGTEFALCQRYFQRVSSIAGVAQNATNMAGTTPFIVAMRTGPTLSQSGTFSITDGYTADFSQSSISSSLLGSNDTSAFLSLGNFSGLTTGRPSFGQRFNTTGYLTFSAEL
jgi:hypothetical protein